MGVLDFLNNRCAALGAAVKQTFLSVTAASVPLPDHRHNLTGTNAGVTPQSLRR